MDVRASDAERDRALERLRAAAVEGRLTPEELADRSEAATRAVMRGELERLIADLPAPLPAVREAAEPVKAMGDIRRSGAWLVPAESRYRSWLGGVQLDLRQARIGRIRQEQSEPAGLGAPRIVLTGGSVFGEIRVRHQRLWEKMARRLIGR